MIDFCFLYLKKHIKYPLNLAIERSYDNTNYRFCQRKVKEKIFFIGSYPIYFFTLSF